MLIRDRRTRIYVRTNAYVVIVLNAMILWKGAISQAACHLAISRVPDMNIGTSGCVHVKDQTFLSRLALDRFELLCRGEPSNSSTQMRCKFCEI